MYTIKLQIKFINGISYIIHKIYKTQANKNKITVIQSMMKHARYIHTHIGSHTHTHTLTHKQCQQRTHPQTCTPTCACTQPHPYTHTHTRTKIQRYQYLDQHTGNPKVSTNPTNGTSCGYTWRMPEI